MSHNQSPGEHGVWCWYCCLRCKHDGGVVLPHSRFPRSTEPTLYHPNASWLCMLHQWRVPDAVEYEHP
uniref:Uncharacterized protein n=1 Tax=Arundo donax TaxID=35708 RepID=A0A0A8Y0J0_ARUDO